MMAQQLQQSLTCATDETIITARTPTTENTNEANNNNNNVTESKLLFGSGSLAIDKESGLPLVDGLNRELEICIISKDVKTVLAVLDVNNLANLNDKFTYSGADIKIGQIGIIVRKYCEENSYKMKGFKVNEKGKNDVFAVLIRYNRNIENSQRYVENLMDQIKLLTYETVCVGMAKFDRFENKVWQWKLRAFQCLELAKEEMRIKSGTGKANNNNLYFDVNEVFVNNIYNNNNKSENEKEAEKTGSKSIYSELGNQSDFFIKMKEIAHKEDDTWFACIMDLDDFGTLMWQNDDIDEIEREKIAKESKKEVVNELLSLFKALGGFNKYYFGYKLTDGDEFGIIVCNRKNDNLIVNGHEILEILREKIEKNCKVTVSIGYAKINVEMEQTVKEWYKVLVKCLKQGKKSGKNLCVNEKKSAKLESMKDDNYNDNEYKSFALEMDEKIIQESLKAIKV